MTWRVGRAAVVGSAVAIGGALVLLVAGCGLETRGASCDSNAAPALQEWTVDGTITSVATHCGTIFVGGSFGWIGRSTGSAAIVDRVSGRSRRFPRFSGTVNAGVPDGRGGWFVGGAFRAVDGRSCHALAHVRRGVVDWCPAARLGEVRWLGVGDGRLYVSIGHDAAFVCCAHLLAFDLRHPTGPLWEILLPPRRQCRASGNCGPVSRVDAFAAQGRTVYAGGIFGSVHGSGRDLLAVDGASGRVLDWNAHVTNDRRVFPTETEVGALAIAGDRLLVGGAFTRIGGAARMGIAAVDRSTGRATSWRPRLRMPVPAFDTGDAWVFAIVPSSSRVFVTGNFDAAAGQRAPGFAALDPVDARPLRWKTSLRFARGELYPVAADRGLLYVAGAATVDGETAYIAAVDTRTGRATSWRPRPNGRVYTVATSGRDVLVAGSFSSVNTIRRTGLAAIDGPHARVLPWHPDLRIRAGLPPVRSLLAARGRLYAGGSFFSIDGSPRRGVAAFDLPSLRLDPWHPRIDGDPWSEVKSLALVGDTLAVGGNFKAINRRWRHGFGAVSATTGGTIGRAAFFDEYSGSVVRLLAVGDTVYAGGTFTTQGPGLVAFDGRTGARKGWFPVLNDPVVVDALAAAGGSLYVGGIDLTSAGPLARVAVEDGRQLPLDARIVGADYPPGTVDAVLATPAGVYIAGDFKRVGGVPRNGTALLDPTTGHVKSWTPPSCSRLDTDGDHNPARVLLAVGGRIITNCRAYGDGERLVVVRAPPRR